MALPGWLKAVTQFAPLILSATPLAPLVPFIVAGITTAEVAANKSPLSGADKLNLAISEVQNGIAATNAQAGKQIIDPKATADLISAGINTVVQVANYQHTFGDGGAATAAVATASAAPSK